MPSRSTYERCLKAGYAVDQIAYERYDAPLSNDDLEHLFGLLSSFKDSRGRHPIITANCLVANPDFDAIEASDFQEYRYQLITETFREYPNHDRCFALWQEATAQRTLRPQFHGREHLNVSRFMSALQGGDPDALFAFRQRMPGIIPKGSSALGNRYVEATRFQSQAEKEYVLKALLEGLELFQVLFGYRSDTLIPTNYTWSIDFDEAMWLSGVTAFQGNGVMADQQADGTRRLVRRSLGDQNELGQRYLVRNATFEPSLFRLNIASPVDQCLYEIQAAFHMGKPAIIRTHRLNFCGFIDPGNRDRTLKLLSEMLAAVIKRWPNVEFMSSDQLADVIRDAPAQRHGG